MRKIPGLLASVSIAGALLLAGSVSANDKYKDVSSQLVREAGVAFMAERTEDAQLLFERALVANPANIDALIGLGKTHEALGKVGRGLKYYRQALAIDPNAFPALEAQAVAFLKRDMVDRAEANRDKLARLCVAGCDALENVEVAIEGYRAEKADAQIADASRGQE